MKGWVLVLYQDFKLGYEFDYNKTKRLCSSCIFLSFFPKDIKDKLN